MRTDSVGINRGRLAIYRKKIDGVSGDEVNNDESEVDGEHRVDDWSDISVR